MKKLVVGLIFILLITFSLLVGYSEDKDSYSIKMDVNPSVINHFENQEKQTFTRNTANSESPIFQKNEEKFGMNNKDFKLNLNFSVSNDQEDYGQVKIVQVEVNGEILNESNSFPFKGQDEIYLVHLNGRNIFFGNIMIDLTHKGGNEEGVLSLRYEPGADLFDATITSGQIGDLAMIPFGELFLTKDDVFEIDTLIQEAAMKQWR